MDGKDAQQRARRTLFVHQLPPNTKDDDLYELFHVGSGHEASTVVDIKVMPDQNNPGGSAVAYIEFASESAVSLRIDRNGALVRGFPIIVEKVDLSSARGFDPGTDCCVYIGGVPQTVRHEDFVTLVNSFGPVTLCELASDVFPTFTGGDPEGAHHRAYVVRYGRGEHAHMAKSMLGETIVHSQLLRAGFIFPPTGRRAAPAQAGGVVSSSAAQPTAALQVPAIAPEDPDNVGLENDEANYSKDGVKSLQAKLSNAKRAREPVSAPPVNEAPMVCVELLNVFVPEQEESENGAEWKHFMQEDMMAECKQFGEGPTSVELIVDEDVVGTQRAAGGVIITFRSEADAFLCYKKMHQRMFSGRRLEAKLMTQDDA